MTTPIERLRTEAQEQGSTQQDLAWLENAYAGLITGSVKNATAESAVRSALRLQASTGESLHALHGDAREWARLKIAGWKQAGTANAFHSSMLASPVEVAATVLISVAIFAPLLLLSQILTQGFLPELRAAALFAPPVLALGSVLVGVVYNRSKVRWGFAPAVGVSALATALFAGCAAGLSSLLQGSPRISAWWLLAEAAVALVLLVILFRFDDARGTAPADIEPTPEGTEAWVSALRQELNKRNDISDARIREEVERVKEHLAQTGTSAVDEFGHPASYATMLSGQKKVFPYRELLYQFVLLVAGAYWLYLGLTAQDGSSWWRVPLAALLIIFSVVLARRHYRSYRQAASGRRVVSTAPDM